MQDYLRCDAVEQLHNAWREAALGAPDHAKRHIGEALELLDHAVQQGSESTASSQKVRDYIESARAAVGRADTLGVVLALVAAQQELEHERAKDKL
jgi:outer membrane PBP1 activator LpoA protein